MGTRVPSVALAVLFFRASLCMCVCVCVCVCVASLWASLYSLCGWAQTAGPGASCIPTTRGCAIARRRLLFFVSRAARRGIAAVAVGVLDGVGRVWEPTRRNENERRNGGNERRGEEEEEPAALPPATSPVREFFCGFEAALARARRAFFFDGLKPKLKVSAGQRSFPGPSVDRHRKLRLTVRTIQSGRTADVVAVFFFLIARKSTVLDRAATTVVRLRDPSTDGLKAATAKWSTVRKKASDPVS